MGVFRPSPREEPLLSVCCLTLPGEPRQVVVVVVYHLMGAFCAQGVLDAVSAIRKLFNDSMGTIPGRVKFP